MERVEDVDVVVDVVDGNIAAGYVVDVALDPDGSDSQRCQNMKTRCLKLGTHHHRLTRHNMKLVFVAVLLP